MITGQMFLYALLGGILPALLWLWFWLKEDKARPEPRGMILLSFIAGMLTVFLAIFFESIAVKIFPGVLTIAIAAGPIEELLKYAVAAVVILRRKANDEPIDAIIYMITVALGFAALENTLFLLNVLVHGQFIETILTGNLRFFGATLLHTLASAIVGGAMALAFYKKRGARVVYTTIGLVFAVVLHSLFNFFIIMSDGEKVLVVFFFVWTGIIALFLLFEKAKKIYNRDLIK